MQPFSGRRVLRPSGNVVFSTATGPFLKERGNVLRRANIQESSSISTFLLGHTGNQELVVLVDTSPRIPFRHQIQTCLTFAQRFRSQVVASSREGKVGGWDENPSRCRYPQCLWTCLSLSQHRLYWYLRLPPAVARAPSWDPIKLGLGLLEEEIGPSIANTATSLYINWVPRSSEEGRP